MKVSINRVVSPRTEFSLRLVYVQHFFSIMVAQQMAVDQIFAGWMSGAHVIMSRMKPLEWRKTKRSSFVTFFFFFFDSLLRDDSRLNSRRRFHQAANLVYFLQ